MKPKFNVDDDGNDYDVKRIKTEPDVSIETEVDDFDGGQVDDFDGGQVDDFDGFGQMDDFDETNEETSRQNDEETMGKNQA